MILTSAGNPILAQIRAAHLHPNNQIHLADRVAMWIASLDARTTFGGYTSWNSPTNPRHVLTTCTDAEAHHAYRVLEHLAALAEGSS